MANLLVLSSAHLSLLRLLKVLGIEQQLRLDQQEARGLGLRCVLLLLPASLCKKELDQRIRFVHAIQLRMLLLRCLLL